MGKQFRWDRIAAGGALRDDLAQASVHYWDTDIR